MLMEYIPAQESAKRALEIAASGSHFIRLFGALGECRYLKAAFPSIEGEPKFFLGLSQSVSMALPALYVEVDETSEIDLLLPPPAEKSWDIALRVQNSRKFLASERDFILGVEAEKLLTLAKSRGIKGDWLLIARTLAAMDGVAKIQRIHIAEALSYRNQQ